MTVPEVISFYTRNTPYEQEAEVLRRSCATYGIEIDIEGIDSVGEHQGNVALKPGFILEKRKKKRGPLLWIDADAVVLQAPDFSIFEGVDFSVRFMTLFQDRPECAIGTGAVFIADTPEATSLCQRWAQRVQTLCEGKGAPPFIDQIALYEVLLTNELAKVLPLPPPYCSSATDQFVVPAEDVVIERRQLSRAH